VPTSDDSLGALEAAVEQASRDHGWSSPQREVASARLLEAALADARRRGDEYATELDLGVEWEPNGDDARLIQTNGQALLILDPHFADDDQRLVIFEWVWCSGAVLSGPNDEARSGHRLWRYGLVHCDWAAEVHNSRWIAQLEQQNRVHDRHDPSNFEVLRHFVLLLKEDTFEVIAEEFRLHRHPGPWPEAAASLLA
jgi:hypothetical protein